MSGGGHWQQEVANRRAAGESTHAASGVIPEREQRGIRGRLRLMRISKGKTTTNFACTGSGTINTYELHDISTMKLGTAYQLAQELGEGFGEFLVYLVGGEAGGDPTPVARNIQTMNVLMRALTVEDQQLLLDMLQPFVDRVLGGRRPVPPNANEARRDIARQRIAERVAADG